MTRFASCVLLFWLPRCTAKANVAAAMVPVERETVTESLFQSGDIQNCNLFDETKPATCPSCTLVEVHIDKAIYVWLKETDTVEELQNQLGGHLEFKGVALQNEQGHLHAPAYKGEPNEKHPSGKQHPAKNFKEILEKVETGKLKNRLVLVKNSKSGLPSDVASKQYTDRVAAWVGPVSCDDRTATCCKDAPCVERPQGTIKRAPLGIQTEGLSLAQRGSPHSEPIYGTMWANLYASMRISNFNELVDKWYLDADTDFVKNAMQYYSCKGMNIEALGVFPFITQFCTQEWLPGLSGSELATLRAFFFEKYVLTDSQTVNGQKVFAMFQFDKNRTDLKVELGKTGLGLKGVRINQVIKPFEALITFMGGAECARLKGEVCAEPKNGGKYGSTGATDKGDDDPGDDEEEDAADEDEDDEDEDNDDEEEGD